MISMSFKKYNFIKIGSKLIFSMFLSLTMLALIVITNNKWVLFSFFTMVNYVSVEVILHVFTRNTNNYYDKVIEDLYQIQSNYIHRVELSDEKKQILKYKFLHVREHFVKSILTLQFLKTDSYNPELEIESVKAIAEKTVLLYLNDMNKAGVSDEFIECFNKIHEPATTKFLNSLIKSITHESLILERRSIFRIELVKLMTLSVKHFLQTIVEENNK